MRWIDPAPQDTAAATLERQFRSAADKLRADSGLTAKQYHQSVLGLTFLRFTGAKFAAHRAGHYANGGSGPSLVTPPFNINCLGERRKP